MTFLACVAKVYRQVPAEELVKMVDQFRASLRSTHVLNWKVDMVQVRVKRPSGYSAWWMGVIDISDDRRFLKVGPYRPGAQCGRARWVRVEDVTW